MYRTDIINHLISKNQYKTYLEIGVHENHNFVEIKCQYKIGIDPNGKTSFTGTSDEFFDNNKLFFDIIFIDGDHREEQVTPDILNSLKCLNKCGMIVLHDLLPPTEQHQTAEYNGGAWNGTVWKSLAKLRLSRPDLKLNVVNTDWGCGILRYGESELYQEGIGQELNFDFYLKHREKMFNVITPDQFLQMF